MDLMRPVGRAVTVAALLVGSLAPAAAAEAYPNRPVRLMVGFAAGGGADIGGRILAAALTERWGQTMIVENRTGAGGMIAAELVAHGAPDGYTLVACSSNHVFAPHLYKHLTFDPINDFEPISASATLPNILVVHKTLPYQTLGELIADAKAHPGKLTYGSSGIGASLHLTMELFKTMAGVDIVHVPYKGGSASLADVIAGHTDMMFGNATEQVGAVKSGQVRALGVSSLTRHPALPDVPTIAEAGVPGFEVVTWYGVCAPRGVPTPILDKLNADMVAAMATETYRRRCAEQGILPAPMSRPEYAAFIEAQSEKWTPLIKRLGIQPE
ncbi:MAG TPA: tripartite tricarboxylate transporter substrate binding protein [Candidatus Sulfotelmatobacter sp.]|nr:tripartite tricarboxylate transporter substrate binding protein [Candidatus Sulfotelmatobacter sp.]